MSLCLRSGSLETAPEDAVWVQGFFWGELLGSESAGVKEAGRAEGGGELPGT